MKIHVVALLAALSVGSGCAATKQFMRDFDKCEAVKYAVHAQDISAATSALVCQVIKDPTKKAKCLAERQKYLGYGNLILQFGASVLQACGIDVSSAPAPSVASTNKGSCAVPPYCKLAHM